jgi:hypothetical protein
MSEDSTYYQRRYEPRLRAGDRDRDAIADLLREQHLAGRLETDEFQERLDRCYAAKTFAELDELVADLPREAPTRPVQPPWRWPALVLVPLLIAAIAVSGGHLLWLAIPLFFFVGRPLMWRSRRFGWGFAGCGARQSPPPGTYV